MSVERAPLEHDNTATQHDWSAPIAMFVAWIARLFEQITKLKRIRRTTTFKANWRDHWAKLRQCEWIRDQILAATAARLLAGQDLDIDFTPSTEPPADYGGPCPRTPFEMNRRILAIARFNANPEAAVDAYARRIAKRKGIDLGGCPLRHDAAHRDTSPALRAEEENTGARGMRVSSLADRRGRWRALARVGGGSHSSRGPPLHPWQNLIQLTSQAPACENASACPIPLSIRPHIG